MQTPATQPGVISLLISSGIRGGFHHPVSADERRHPDYSTGNRGTGLLRTSPAAHCRATISRASASLECECSILSSAGLHFCSVCI